MQQGQQIPFLPSTPAKGAFGYLTASKDHRQPLCGNNEGWGPISPIRYDFTPCFLDVWIATVAVFGIVGGAGALWYLYRNCTPQPVKRNWHFFAKLVRSICRPSKMHISAATDHTRLCRLRLEPSSLRPLYKPPYKSNTTKTYGSVTSASGPPSSPLYRSA
jgi:hypothetical protein